MSTTEIAGLSIAYEVMGEGSRAAVVTPGGRYSKDIVGVRELAARLAENGFRVLIWDRPNCGASDVGFAAESESIQNADTLAGLLRHLDMAPALLVAGSGAAREALLTAIRHSDVVERLFLFWISGGSIGLSTLAYSYYADLAIAASSGGMEAVVALPTFREQIERNPGNRDRLLALDPAAFVETLFAWGWAFFPEQGSPVPGMLPAELAAIGRPTMILRGSALDMHHPRATSEAVQALIPGARIAEPPWDEREWPRRLDGFARGESGAANWPMLAPQILAFAQLETTS